MTSVSRIDQAILLLKERLRRLDRQGAGKATRTDRAASGGTADRLVPIRQLARRGGIAEREVHRALVRTLLADSLGDELAQSLEFQSISDDVARILEENEAGRLLLSRVLAELG